MTALIIETGFRKVQRRFKRIIGYRGFETVVWLCCFGMLAVATVFMRAGLY